ncbi:MAG: hypothetical protein ACXWG8_07790 [Usitatibacter sp.]
MDATEVVALREFLCTALVVLFDCDAVIHGEVVGVGQWAVIG